MDSVDCDVIDGDVRKFCTVTVTVPVMLFPKLSGVAPVVVDSPFEAVIVMVALMVVPVCVQPVHVLLFNA
jgi:hypothetical protein